MYKKHKNILLYASKTTTATLKPYKSSFLQKKNHTSAGACGCMQNNTG